MYLALRILFLLISVHALSRSICVQDVIPLTSARLADIFRRVSLTHIHQHLQQSQACLCLTNKNCFSILDCMVNKLLYNLC